eukprot:365455-Chlamydomonas_euryale.AAC.14
MAAISQNMHCLWAGLVRCVAAWQLDDTILTSSVRIYHMDNLNRTICDIICDNKLPVRAWCAPTLGQKMPVRPSSAKMAVRPTWTKSVCTPLTPLFQHERLMNGRIEAHSKVHGSHPHACNAEPWCAITTQSPGRAAALPVMASPACVRR